MPQQVKLLANLLERTKTQLQNKLKGLVGIEIGLDFDLIYLAHHQTAFREVTEASSGNHVTHLGC